MPLSWQTGLSVKNKPPKVIRTLGTSKPRHVSEERTEKKLANEKVQDFRFVTGNVPKRRKIDHTKVCQRGEDVTHGASPAPRRSSVEAAAGIEPLSRMRSTPQRTGERIAEAEESGTFAFEPQDEPLPPLDQMNPWPLRDDEWTSLPSGSIVDPEMPGNFEMTSPLSYSVMSQGSNRLAEEQDDQERFLDLDSPHYLDAASQSSGEITLSSPSSIGFSARLRNDSFMSIGPQMLYADINDKFGGLLNMCSSISS